VNRPEVPPACPDSTLHELILLQARQTPGAVALRQWDRRLSYAELTAAAGRLARQLSGAGVGPESRVGICARRSLALPVAVLGVMLAGGAYVPLDPGHPRRRLEAILADAAIEVAVVDDAGRALLDGAGCHLVHVTSARRADRGTAGREAGGARPGNAAYVLYTSGSTGRPKGVVVTHRNAVAFTAAVCERLVLDENSRSAGFAALGFDTSVFDFIIPLTRGAAVQFIPDEDRIDPARLQRFLREHQVTTAMLPPAVLPLLDPLRLPELAHIFVAGEPCGPEQVVRWSAPPARRFYNWYGPTETTVIVVGAELTGSWQRPLPIGRPLPGCRAYVLDELGRPCPPGTAGELCIGGPQLARGYLGQPGQTAARFVPDPFGDTPGERLYRTGDLVRREPDGMLGYLGRLDRQVKIQGQRVEIGEVETVLRSHPGIRQAVVDVAAGAAGLKHLVAYLAPADAPGLAELRVYAGERLPPYMVPTGVIRVAALPLNLSGKVDMAALRALAESGAQGAGGAGAQGAGGAEGAVPTVAAAWAEVFESAQPGPEDDFLASGGHSLLAMRLVSVLRARAQRHVAVEDIFAGRTVTGIAARVEAAPRIQDEDILAGSVPALSPAQRQMWFLEQFTPGIAAHNVAMAQLLRGRLDLCALRAALRLVAARHEVLRWRIPHSGGVPSVAVDPPADVPLPVDDLSSMPRAERETALRDLLDRAAGQPFDLAAGPLWRARLVRLADEEYVLTITIHHIVFDGWSWHVLYRDIARGYRAALADERPAADPLPATFADYAAWLARRGAADRTRGLSWWADHLDGAARVLDLPRDHPRPPIKTFRGASASIEVGSETTARVRALAARAGVTRYTVLLAAFAQLVRRLTGNRDLIVGTPFADRGHVAFEQAIGLLLQVLPVRLKVDDDATFAEHVRRCGDEVNAVLAHAGEPLGRIVETLGGQRDLTRNPLIQVLFNMYNFAEPRIELPGITASPMPPGLPGSLFDLTLYVSEYGDGLALQAVYNPDLYDPGRIDALLAGYCTLLAGLTARPDSPAGAASLRPPGSDLPGPHTPLPRWDGPGVVERVLAAAAARPGAVAATGQGGVLRYRDVTALSERIAAAVRAAGVRSGGAVAVLGARDGRLPAVLLGVLATGARWVILDPALPSRVLGRQARAARVEAVIRFRREDQAPPVDPAAARLPLIDLELLGSASPIPAGQGEPLSARGYLALSSGTTGEPKVIRTPERPLAHFLDWYPATFGLDAADRFAMLAGLAHDPMLRDVFTPLVLGAVLCVPEQLWLRDPGRLAAWLRAENVTVAHLTPQLARLLVTGCRDADTGFLPALRLIALAGDQATDADARDLRGLAPGARIVNFYGTTETPQAQAWHDVTDNGAVRHGASRPGAGRAQPLPAGRGIDGAQLLVLGPHGQPAAVGELGQIGIRSRYLATGYADDWLTAHRFTAASGGDGEDRIFLSGDLGRYRPDGTVTLAGRADDQVKIRGFRVELGEVEAALAAHPDVRQACVIAAEGDGERVLRAYAVPARAGIQAQQLYDYMRAELPEYAVPAGVTLLSALPLTPNGKVDTAALPRSPLRPVSGPAGELASGAERVIAGVWREVLGLVRIGPHDNFFEVGGHSLTLVAVQAKLTRLLARPVSVVDLFQYPSIRALASHLDGDGRGDELERGLRRAAQRRQRVRHGTRHHFQEQEFADD
jgi:amino acid adenylation domain-containing protein